jgi:hypothetical protein
LIKFENGTLLVGVPFFVREMFVKIVSAFCLASPFSASIGDE